MHSFNFAIASGWVLGLTSVIFGSTVMAGDLYKDLDHYVAQRLRGYPETEVL
ncbi:hypothetical protein KOR42_49000 [Thalassoglobus neptunius]|uniref:Uncharacterized protein n=1 Tax=Thalassoglobus neptunius TaxID=1938619 RepID=A0A5C5VRC0_9PLAN|nr:hypothetical protein [Thalassoglobus neptunius]TWT40697.1 hypothetical protein KOR42_49000 [Thalassoglobus neptunius]